MIQKTKYARFKATLFDLGRHGGQVVSSSIKKGVWSPGLGSLCVLLACSPWTMWVLSRFSSVHTVGVNTSVGVCLSLYYILYVIDWRPSQGAPHPGPVSASTVNEWIIWFIRPLEGITTICKHNEDDEKGDNAFTRHSPIYFMHLSGFWLKWDSKD